MPTLEEVFASYFDRLADRVCDRILERLATRGGRVTLNEAENAALASVVRTGGAALSERRPVLAAPTQDRPLPGGALPAPQAVVDAPSPPPSVELTPEVMKELFDTATRSRLPHAAPTFPLPEGVRRASLDPTK